MTRRHDSLRLSRSLLENPVPIEPSPPPSTAPWVAKPDARGSYNNHVAFEISFGPDIGDGGTKTTAGGFHFSSGPKRGLGSLRLLPSQFFKKVVSSSIFFTNANFLEKIALWGS